MTYSHYNNRLYVFYTYFQIFQRMFKGSYFRGPILKFYEGGGKIKRVIGGKGGVVEKINSRGNTKKYIRQATFIHS